MCPTPFVRHLLSAAVGMSYLNTHTKTVSIVVYKLFKYVCSTEVLFGNIDKAFLADILLAEATAKSS